MDGVSYDNSKAISRVRDGGCNRADIAIVLEVLDRKAEILRGHQLRQHDRDEKPVGDLGVVEFMYRWDRGLELRFMTLMLHSLAAVTTDPKVGDLINDIAAANRRLQGGAL